MEEKGIECVGEIKFFSSLSFFQMLKKLMRLYPNWQWHKRDSEFYGDYLSGCSNGLFMRITEDGYCCQLKFHAKGKEDGEWNTIIDEMEKMTEKIK